ncbi:MAG: hypothetical protein JKY31_09420 [Rhodobacteraceae bacterium]|nr:hypothetical protein [Paracoccaceae bacterium]
MALWKTCTNAISGHQIVINFDLVVMIHQVWDKNHVHKQSVVYFGAGHEGEIDHVWLRETPEEILGIEIH